MKKPQTVYLYYYGEFQNTIPNILYYVSYMDRTEDHPQVFHLG